MHVVLLRGRCFWHINLPSSPSWSWRKILQSRNWCKGLFTSHIRNGMTIFIWLDYWLPNGRRLCDLLPFRFLSTSGLIWNAKVSDIISNGRLVFPSGYQDLQPIWNSIIVHPQTNQLDTLHLAGALFRQILDSLHVVPYLLFRANPLSCLHPLDYFRWVGYTLSTNYSPTRSLPTRYASFVVYIQRHMNIYFSNVPTPHGVERPLSLYFLLYERNNIIFNQIYRTTQELKEEAFEVIKVCLMNKDPHNKLSIFKSLWQLLAT